MFNAQNISVQIQDKTILKDFNLSINAGEIHAVMGLNGAGKSTLSKAISGHHDCEVTGGKMLFKDKDILELSPDERANEGIFMSFQNPVEIPGVNNLYFLKSVLNAKEAYRGEKESSSSDILKKVQHIAKQFNLDKSMLNRGLNDGFSGGEKKKNELLQMLLLEPEFVILDEIDSGLDIDALKIVAQGLNAMRNDNRSFLLITHYQRLLDLIKPDFVHILKEGKIAKTGDHTLALELEEKGYEAH